MKTAGVLGGFLTGLFTFAAKDIGAALMTVNGARPPLHSIAKASCASGGAAGHVGLPISDKPWGCLCLKVVESLEFFWFCIAGKRLGAVKGLLDRVTLARCVAW
jgi:hypothetical protein